MSEITLEAVLRDILFQMSRAEGKRVSDIANCFIAEYLNEPCFKFPISRLNKLVKADSMGEGIKTCENCKEILSERQMYINACEQIKALQNLLQKRNEMLKEKDKILCGHNHDRINELVKADKEGKCLILPVKNNASVWFIKLERSITFFPIKANCVSVSGLTTDGDIWYTAITEYYGISQSFYGSDLNKTVFLTREEAEQALKERKNK